ncbi:hypothetical protein GGH94_002686 [Coemansia aciculifera]|uniref:Uncharacterized protein n=1 Tax=Coemansia aciculifera TaxID=417176 RepID=A0A9W8ILL6_9FUNG|nr:hypothetical protein GGH94_002686 [Coemansia aciculifera]
MLELRVVVDRECAECLVYQHQESALRGKLFIKTGDKLKLRQITIRLVSTELVDIHENGEVTAALEAAGNGFLQKSTKTIGTWVVLAKGSDTHVLGVGEHQYSFEIALPKGLDGTVDSGAYRLGYELESRVEHSFVLKPASVMVTPVTLVQVPMGLNLHSDDRVSMNMLPGVAPGRSLAPKDVPLGRAVCVHTDAIDQGKEFVLRHLWDSALAVRLRLSRGRVFPTDAYAVVDIQAVPITREYRCTRITLRLEEIAIIARPQRSQAAAAAARQASTRTRPGSSLAPLRRHSVANSAMSNSSEDSVLASNGRTDNAAAYAQECSAEYQNAITKVRTLATGTHTAWPERPSVSLAEFSGIASARLRLHVPPMYGDNATHTDIRNSHIQVHHQIAYEVRYERVQAEEESSNARILAVAKVYGALANANIVRRDELKNLEVVRGTLPVAVVPKKISALWGLKNIEYDEPEYDDEPAGFPVPNTTEAHLIDLVADAPPVAAQSAYVPSSAMLDMMHNNDSYASTMPSMPSMPGMPESATVIESAAVTEASAPASSEPVRPDSAADIDTSSADQPLTLITAATERSEAEASNTITTAVPVLQPLAHSAGSSTSTTASSEHNTEDTGRHSPPPNYDDLLPPDYEVPANQPPPYRPMESSRSRRRVWDI